MLYVFILNVMYLYIFPAQKKKFNKNVNCGYKSQIDL